MKQNLGAARLIISEFSSAMKHFLSLALAVLAASLLLSACTMSHSCSAYADAEVVCEE